MQYFKADDYWWYQLYDAVPYHLLEYDIYKSAQHKEISKKVEKHFLEGNMYLVKGEPRKTNEYLQQRILGQPYFRGYKSGTYVFYLKIINNSAEKVKLYPAHSGVLIDSKGNQVSAL